MIIWRGSIYCTISKTQLFQILTTVFNVATVNSLIMEKLPKDARISTSSKDMIIQLCMTFLTSLSAKANNVCGAKNKKTVFLFAESPKLPPDGTQASIFLIEDSVAEMLAPKML